MGDIFESTEVTKLLGNFDCAIGLDISRRSSGIALYQNGIMRLYKISTESKYSKDDNMWEAKMKSEFKKDLSSIVRGKVFDLVVIENTINGCNAITNKELTLLNSVFDDLVVEKVCSINGDRLVRPFPNVWRAELKKLADVGKQPDTKILVEMILNKLGYAYVREHLTDLLIKKKQQGYYDMCDATGMLIGYMNKIMS